MTHGSLQSIQTGRQRDVVAGPSGSALHRWVLALALPMVAEAATHNVFNFVELFWIGPLGPVSIGAVGVGHAVLLAFLGAASGWGAAGAAAVARRVGMAERDKASAVGTGFIFWGIIGGTLLGVGSMGIIAPVVQVLGFPADVSRAARPYLQITLGAIGLISGANISPDRVVGAARGRPTR